jgi:cyclase
MDADGTRAGYDTELIRKVREITHVPLIASGGAGKLEDFSMALEAGADALLAASVFHFQTFTINEVKDDLAKHGYPVRR